MVAPSARGSSRNLSSLRGLTAAASLRALSSCELTARTLRLALQQLQQLPGDQLVQQTIRSYAKADEPLLAPEVRPLLRRELAGLRLPDAGLHLHPVGDAFVCVRDEDGGDADGGGDDARSDDSEKTQEAIELRPAKVEGFWLIVFEEAGSLRAALAAAGAHPGAADALSELTKAARGAVTRATTRLLLERLDSMHELDERLLPPNGAFAVPTRATVTLELHDRLRADYARTLRSVCGTQALQLLATDRPDMFVYRQSSDGAVFLLQLALSGAAAERQRVSRSGSVSQISGVMISRSASQSDVSAPPSAAASERDSARFSVRRDLSFESGREPESPNAAAAAAAAAAPQSPAPASLTAAAALAAAAGAPASAPRRARRRSLRQSSCA